MVAQANSQVAHNPVGILHKTFKICGKCIKCIQISPSSVARPPDNITEELVAALSGSKSYEFKALFSVIHAALRARNAASGGEEMLRLRTYDKLQNLVRHGQVKKTGKKYKGVTNALLLLSESLKEFRKNGPSFSPRSSLARQ
jgi:hypothetical protein